MAGRQPTEIADKLLNYFPHYGISEINIFGSGTEFKNSVYKELIMWYKIKIHFTSTQHLQSNGICERFYSTLNEHIRIFNNREEFKNKSIENKIKYALVAYNSSINNIHSVFLLFPFEIYEHVNPNSLLEVDAQ